MLRLLICLCAQTREAQELQRQAQDLDTQVKELKKAASKHQQQGAAIKRTCNSQQAALDALNMRRADLLAAAAMEQVRLLCCLDCLEERQEKTSPFGVNSSNILGCPGDCLD